MRALQELFNRLIELAEEGYANFVVDSATMRDVSAFVRKGGLVGKALLGSNGIKINFRAEENTWGGDIFVPVSSSGMEEHVVGFDSARIYACFATSRKGEEMSVGEREGKWIMSDGKNRTWTHTLSDSAAGAVTHMEELEGSVGEIKLFYDREYVKRLLKDIAAAEKATKYEEIIFVTEGTEIVLYLYGNETIEIDRKDTEYERGASVAIYPLAEFKTVLKAMRVKGATDGVKIYFAPEKLMRLVFPIQKGKADVLIAPKLDPNETFGEFFPELHRRDVDKKEESMEEEQEYREAVNGDAELLRVKRNGDVWIGIDGRKYDSESLSFEKEDIEQVKEDQQRYARYDSMKNVLARGVVRNPDAFTDVGRVVRLERSETGNLLYVYIEGNATRGTDTKKRAFKQLENAKRRFTWLTQKEVEEK